MPSTTVIRSIPDAPWLPAGGLAEVVLADVAPRPASVVRLLAVRGETVFCLPRADSGRLDLPMRVVPDTDSDGRTTALRLARDLCGTRATVHCVGFVRNSVSPVEVDYPWPTPEANFTVWASDEQITREGSWVTAFTEESPLSDRHWFPLLAALTGQSALQYTVEA